MITAEHILAAFAGLGIHNAFVELSEAELPIFDGSSRTFVKAILQSGVIELEKKIQKVLSLFMKAEKTQSNEASED